MPITTEEYQNAVFAVLDYIKTDIITPNSPGSHIETRYIAPEGQDDEQWLGFLRDQNMVVDIWCMTIANLTGLPQEDERRGSVGTVTKPITIIIDYFADYRQGVDYVEDVATNTEREFLKKVLAVDLALEQKKGCLDADKILIRSWDYILKLKRFDNATVHWANGLLRLELVDLFI